MAHKLERKSMRKLLMILSIFTTVSVYADSDINSDQAIADCARENKNCDRINAAIKNDTAKTNRVLEAMQHTTN